MSDIDRQDSDDNNGIQASVRKGMCDTINYSSVSLDHLYSSNHLPVIRHEEVESDYSKRYVDTSPTQQLQKTLTMTYSHYDAQAMQWIIPQGNLETIKTWNDKEELVRDKRCFQYPAPTSRPVFDEHLVTSINSGSRPVTSFERGRGAAKSSRSVLRCGTMSGSSVRESFGRHHTRVKYHEDRDNRVPVFHPRRSQPLMAHVEVDSSRSIDLPFTRMNHITDVTNGGEGIVPRHIFPRDVQQEIELRSSTSHPSGILPVNDLSKCSSLHSSGMLSVNDLPKCSSSHPSGMLSVNVLSKDSSLYPSGMLLVNDLSNSSKSHPSGKLSPKFEDDEDQERMDAYVKKFSHPPAPGSSDYDQQRKPDISERPITLEDAVTKYIDHLITENERRTCISDCMINLLPLDFQQENYYHDVMSNPVRFPTHKFRDWLRWYNVDVEITDPAGRVVTETTFPPVGADRVYSFKENCEMGRITNTSVIRWRGRGGRTRGARDGLRGGAGGHIRGFVRPRRKQCAPQNFQQFFTSTQMSGGAYPIDPAQKYPLNDLNNQREAMLTPKGVSTLPDNEYVAQSYGFSQREYEPIWNNDVSLDCHAPRPVFCLNNNGVAQFYYLPNMYYGASSDSSYPVALSMSSHLGLPPVSSYPGMTSVSNYRSLSSVSSYPGAPAISSYPLSSSVLSNPLSSSVSSYPVAPSINCYSGYLLDSSISGNPGVPSISSYSGMPPISNNPGISSISDCPFTASTLIYSTGMPSVPSDSGVLSMSSHSRASSMPSYLGAPPMPSYPGTPSVPRYPSTPSISSCAPSIPSNHSGSSILSYLCSLPLLSNSAQANEKCSENNFTSFHRPTEHSYSYPPSNQPLSSSPNEVKYCDTIDTKCVTMIASLHPTRTVHLGVDSVSCIEEDVKLEGKVKIRGDLIRSHLPEKNFLKRKADVIIPRSPSKRLMKIKAMHEARVKAKREFKNVCSSREVNLSIVETYSGNMNVVEPNISQTEHSTNRNKNDEYCTNHNTSVMNNGELNMNQNSIVMNNGELNMNQNSIVMNNDVHCINDNSSIMNNVELDMNQNSIVPKNDEHRMNHNISVMNKDEHGMNQNNSIINSNERDVNHDDRVIMNREKCNTMNSNNSVILISDERVSMNLENNIVNKGEYSMNHKNSIVSINEPSMSINDSIVNIVERDMNIYDSVSMNKYEHDMSVMNRIQHSINSNNSIMKNDAHDCNVDLYVLNDTEQYVTEHILTSSENLVYNGVRSDTKWPINNGTNDIELAAISCDENENIIKRCESRNEVIDKVNYYDSVDCCYLEATDLGIMSTSQVVVNPRGSTSNDIVNLGMDLSASQDTVNPGNLFVVAGHTDEVSDATGSEESFSNINYADYSNDFSTDSYHHAEQGPCWTTYRENMSTPPVNR